MNNKIFDLSGKTVLITGSTQGLGFTLARGFALHGARVILNARRQEALDEAVAVLSAEFPGAVGVLFDVTDAEGIGRSFHELEEKGIQVDILVNNAGIQRRFPLEEIPVAAWNEVIQTNLNAVQFVSQHAVKGMIQRQKGKIINICSLMSELGRYSTGAYAAAKGGVKMLTRAMCTEWAKHNIQINGIGPGYFATEMTQKLVQDQEFSQWLCKRTPAGRWGNPEELVGAAIFLASEASDFVNGQIIYVDGGILAAL